MSVARKDLIKAWKPYLRALDPGRELGVDEIEALYAERPQSPYHKLALDLAVDDPTSQKVILCGARGSGKSTELTRLGRAVRDDFCVVQTDLAAGLPDRAGTLAVVLLLGVAALHALEIWSEPNEGAGTPKPDVRSGKRLQSALAKFGDAMPNVSTLLSGISGVVTVFHPAAGAALAAASSGAKAAGAANVGLRNALARGPLEERLPADKRDDANAVVDAVNEILDELRELSGRPPLLLADGLDKRTGVEEVELALSEEYLLRGLRAPIVLTGPVNLRHDPKFRVLGNFRLELLYNIPVCERGPNGCNPSKDGVGVLAQLYERRRSAAGIPTDVFSSATIDLAARMCSGIVREFLGLLHSTCKQALDAGRERTEPADLEAVIKARRLEMQGFLDEGRLTILRRVLDKGLLPGAPTADTLLFENFIACYPNGDLWFRPHELIVEFVQTRGEPD